MAIMFNAEEGNCRQRLDEKRLQLLNAPLVFEGNEIFCDFSYGLVCFGREGKDYETLIAEADRRMYEHKSRVKSSEI